MKKQTFKGLWMAVVMATTVTVAGCGGGGGSGTVRNDPMPPPEMVVEPTTTRTTGWNNNAMALDIGEHWNEIDAIVEAIGVDTARTETTGLETARTEIGDEDTNTSMSLLRNATKNRNTRTTRWNQLRTVEGWPSWIAGYRPRLEQHPERESENTEPRSNAQPANGPGGSPTISKTER